MFLLSICLKATTNEEKVFLPSTFLPPRPVFGQPDFHRASPSRVLSPLQSENDCPLNKHVKVLTLSECHIGFDIWAHFDGPVLAPACLLYSAAFST